jgi:hypothetical protein
MLVHQRVQPKVKEITNTRGIYIVGYFLWANQSVEDRIGLWGKIVFGVSINGGTPIWIVNGKSGVQLDDLGVPPFQAPPPTYHTSG